MRIVSVFDSGKPENIKTDATHCRDFLGRYINDIDCFKTPNCQPLEHRIDEGEVLIAFFSTRNIEMDEELRYAYNSCYAPWRRPAFSGNSKLKVDKLSDPSEDVKPSLHGEPPQREPSPNLHGEPSQGEPSQGLHGEPSQREPIQGLHGESPQREPSPDLHGEPSER